MKHTRNRQIGKAMKDSSWMTMKNDKISEVKTSELDPTFKWHRDFVWEIEKYWESYITLGAYGKDDFKVIPIK